MALSPGVQGAAIFDFHEVCLGAPILVGWLIALRRRHLWTASLCAAALLLVKEDLTLWVSGIAVVHFLSGSRRSAAGLAGVAVAWWFVATKLVIPHFRSDGYTYTGVLPTGPAEVVSHLFSSLIVPGLETWTLLILVAGFAFRGLRSPLLLAAVPYLAALAIVDNFRYHVFYYHYYLLPVLVLAGAVIDTRHGLDLGTRWRRWLVAVVLAASVAAGPVTVAMATTPWSQRADAMAAIRQIPDGARVAADPGLTARLATRTRVSQVRPPSLVDGRGRPMPDVDWLVLNRDTTTFSGGWVPAMVTTAQGLGFTVVSTHGPFVVMRRH